MDNVKGHSCPDCGRVWGFTSCFEKEGCAAEPTDRCPRCVGWDKPLITWRYVDDFTLWVEDVRKGQV